MIILGVGQDGEQIAIEEVHSLCFLIHAAGNAESPFEFGSENEARQFAELIIKFRIEDNLDKLLGLRSE